MTYQQALEQAIARCQQEKRTYMVVYGTTPGAYEVTSTLAGYDSEDLVAKAVPANTRDGYRLLAPK